MDARRIEVPEDIRTRIRACIRACTDMAQLETWVKRAAVANSITDVLD